MEAPQCSLLALPALLPPPAASPLPAVINSRVVSKNDPRGDLVFLTFPSPQQAAVAVERLQCAQARAAPAAVRARSLLHTAAAPQTAGVQPSFFPRCWADPWNATARQFTLL